MRQANTTFVNLRAALDDLDPLIAAPGASTHRTCPRSCASSARSPTTRSRCSRTSSQALNSSGPDNDLNDSLRRLPGAPDAAARRRCSRRSRRSTSSQHDVAFAALHARPARLPRQASAQVDRLLRRQRPLRRASCRLGRTSSPGTRPPSVLDADPDQSAAGRLPAARHSAPFNRCPGRRHAADRRLSEPHRPPVPRRRQPQRRSATPTTYPLAHEARRRIIVAVVAAAVILRHRQRRGRRRRQLRGPRDLRQRRLPRPGRGGAHRRRQRRLGRRRRRHHRDRARARRRQPDPGKAVVVMQIDDPGFQDFRTDASCLIRPQSLIGEKFVECQPTEPRAPGPPPPPELEADRRRRAGRRPAPAAARAQRQGGRPRPRQQHHARALPGSLPADPQQPRRRPRRAGRRARRDHRALQSGAARDQRGPRRPSPARTKLLAELASDGDAVLERARPRARERSPTSSTARTTTAEATAERSADLERNFAMLPAVPARAALDDGRARRSSPTPATPDFTDSRRGGAGG